MQQNISKLKHVVDALQQQGSVSGDYLVANGLKNLERQALLLASYVTYGCHRLPKWISIALELKQAILLVTKLLPNWMVQNA